MSQKVFKILNRGKGFASIVLVGVILWGFSTPAMAVLILPGQTLPTTGVITYGGTLLLDTGPQAFTGTTILHTVSFTGLLDTKVYSDPANPFGPGDLDFVYQFSNDANPNNDPILNFSITSYSGFLTDADFLAGTGTGGNFPTTVERDSTNAGDTINFVFPLSSDVTPGSLSVQLVIDTNATVPNIGLASLQDGGNASLPAPAPASVPEPATAAIFAVALTAMGIRRNRTNR